MAKLTYKDSGVDAAAADRLVDTYSHLAAQTATPQVLAGIGGFAGFLNLPQGYTNPVLVACTDGVGTKLRLLIDAGQPETAGMDAAAMCLNDLATCGAQPLFMLDYLAVGRLDADTARGVVAGFADYCRRAGCALLGGETAEMPGFYPPGDFDVAGFAVGVAEREAIVDGHQCHPGDTVIGLASSGVHSNGFSLIRMLMNQGLLDADKVYPGLASPLLDALLIPTRLYLPLAQELARVPGVRAMAHITGGGLPGNAARTIPGHLDMILESSRWPLPPVFQALAATGVPRAELFKTFNMGIGFTVVCDPSQAEAVRAVCRQAEVETWVIGHLHQGTGKVQIHD